MKKGFGLLEVMVAAVVLGFMLVGLLYLQKGNREALLRIRARDGAVQIAQEVFDKLQAKDTIYYDKLFDNNGAPKTEGEPITLHYIGSNESPENGGAIIKEWKGNPSGRGTNSSVDVTLKYGVDVSIVDVDEYKVKEYAKDYELNNPDDNFHLTGGKFARQVNITVKWKFRESTQSIQLSGVIR